MTTELTQKNEANSSENRELALTRPSFITEADVQQYQHTDIAKDAKAPQFKIIQSNSDDELKAKFGEGSIIARPMGIKVADSNTEFVFTPVGYFKSFMALNPYQMKSQVPTIAAFSFDEKSDTAKKAMTFAKLPFPGKPDLFIKYHVSFNFLVIVDGIPELKDTPIHMFSTRGEFKSLQSLVNMVQGRWTEYKVPMYGCRFRAVCGRHKGGENKWWGWDFRNDPIPFIDNEETFRKYAKLGSDLRDAILANKVSLDLSDVGDNSEGDPDAANETKF